MKKEGSVGTSSDLTSPKQEGNSKLSTFCNNQESLISSSFQGIKEAGL